MKRISVGMFLGLSGILLVPSGAAALGICLNADSFCNDYYMEISKEGADIWALVGYEYGCGSDQRLASGSMRAEAGTIYIAINGGNGAIFDTAQDATWVYVLDTATLTGTTEVVFTYLSGGALSGHGASDTVTASVCGDPGLAPVAVDPDASR